MADSNSPPALSAVYLNGRILPAADAQLPITDAGVLYGWGFFETFRSSGGLPHHWRFNRARLEQACAKAELLLPSSFLVNDAQRMADTVRTLLSIRGATDAVFRYSVTAGSLGVPTEFLTSRALPSPAPSEGIIIRVLKLRRDSGEWIPRPKSFSYLNASLGGRELQSRTSRDHEEGLFLSQHGDFVVETARQNVIWIKNGRLHTAAAACGPVAGTCLAWIHENKLCLEFDHARLSDFVNAEAIACLSSVRGITPVREIWDERDASRLGIYDTANHPMITDLQRRWRAALEATALGEPLH